MTTASGRVDETPDGLALSHIPIKFPAPPLDWGLLNCHGSQPGAFNIFMVTKWCHLPFGGKQDPHQGEEQEWLDGPAAHLLWWAWRPLPSKAPLLYIYVYPTDFRSRVDILSTL